MLLTTLLLLACGIPSEFIGDDIDDFEATNAVGAIMGDPAVADDEDTAWGGDTCATDTTGVAPTLVLTGGEGAIEVAHLGVVDSCCASFTISAAGDGPGRIVVSYDDTTEGSCSDTAWDLAYAIPGVPAGEWTVSARGETATVTVR